MPGLPIGPVLASGPIARIGRAAHRPRLRCPRRASRPPATFGQAGSLERRTRRLFDPWPDGHGLRSRDEGEVTMRPWAGLLLTTAAAICAGHALAQPVATPAAKRALLNAVFISPPHKAANHPSQFATTTLGVRGETRAVVSAGGVFALPAVTGTALDQTRLLSPANLVTGKALSSGARTRRLRLPSSRRHGSNVRRRRRRGGWRRRVGQLGALLDPDAEAFDVSYTRGWPAAWKMSMGGYALDVTPHAGVGANSVGPTAEAGATLRVGASAEDRVGAASRLACRRRRRSR